MLLLSRTRCAVLGRSRCCYLRADFSSIALHVRPGMSSGQPSSWAVRDRRSKKPMWFTLVCWVFECAIHVLLRQQRKLGLDASKSCHLLANMFVFTKLGKAIPSCYGAMHAGSVFTLLVGISPFWETSGVRLCRKVHPLTLRSCPRFF